MSDENLTAHEIEDDNPFVNLEVGGEPVSIVVERISKNKEGQYKLSNTDFSYKVHTTDGKILSVISWGLWSQIKALIDKTGKIKGLKFRVSKPKKATYLVQEMK